MKKVFSIIAIIMVSMVFVGCGDIIQQPTDTSFAEKRTPIQKDTVKRRIPIEKVLPCLGLTREQDSVIRLILKEEKECSILCKKEFNESVKTLREQYNSKLSDYRGKEKDSLIRKEIEIINFEFRQTLRDLEKEYKLKMKECNDNLYLKIEGILTERQLIAWKQWKETGKLPCDRIKG
jgi:hypothetical protein